MAARRVQLGVGVGLVLLLGVVLALVLLRDPAGGSPSAPSQTTVPTRPDMNQLRAEATAAAETLFKKIDEADATGNPAVLDGLYTEGAKAVEEGQKQAVRRRSAQGLVSVRRTRVRELLVEELTPQVAKVRLRWEVLSGELRDRKTGEVKKRVSGTVTPVLLLLERIDDEWLVSQLTTESEP